MWFFTWYCLQIFYQVIWLYLSFIWKTLWLLKCRLSNPTGMVPLCVDMYIVTTCSILASNHICLWNTLNPAQLSSDEPVRFTFAPLPNPLLKTAKTNEVWSLLIGAPTQTRWLRVWPNLEALLKRTCLDATNPLISLVEYIYSLSFPPGLCVMPCRKCSEPMYWKVTYKNLYLLS